MAYCAPKIIDVHWATEQVAEWPFAATSELDNENNLEKTSQLFLITKTVEQYPIRVQSSISDIIPELLGESHTLVVQQPASLFCILLEIVSGDALVNKCIA